MRSRYVWAKILLALLPLAWAATWWNDRRLDLPPGIILPTRPVIVEMTPFELNQRLAEAQRHAIRGVNRCRRIAIRDLGLIKDIEPDIVGTEKNVLMRIKDEMTAKAQVGAFYIMGTDTLFVLSKGDEAVQHELVHFWEDHRTQRMRSAQDAPSDEQMALRAAIEGTAVRTTEQQPAILQLGKDLDRNSWSVAYSVGPEYVSRNASKPEEWARLHPTTTYDVLFGALPETETKNQAKSPETPLHGTGCSDQLGALGVITAGLKYGLPPTLALRAGRQWRGDKVTSSESETGLRKTRWEVTFADTTTLADWKRVVKQATPLLTEGVTVYGHATARTLASQVKAPLSQSGPNK